MFSRISNCVLDWVNRTEPHQESTNGDHNGANSKESEIKENLHCKRKEINEDTNLIQNEQEGENESRIENEKELEVVRDWEQEKSRITGVVKPEAVDSSSCLQIGLCEFGMNCKFCHCPSSKTQYFDQHGGCKKSGEACNFDNSRMTSLVELNFMGLPIRLGEQDCPYYMHHGSCKFEANCRFNHPDPTSVGESDKLSEDSNEGSNLSSDASQSTLGSWPPAASGESLPYAHLTFPSTQGVPSHPECSAYQAPVHPRGRSIQLASGCATNNQPLARNVYTHQQQQILVEFPERPGQPECSNFLKTGTCRYKSACKYHHPKNESTKSTSSAFSDSGLPLRPAVQPMIQEAFASPSSDAAFTKMFAGQNLVSNVDKSKVKRPKEVPKKKSTSQKALRIGIPAGKASKSINTFCTAGEMGIPIGKGMASVATDIKTKKQSTCSAGENGAPSPSGNLEPPKEKIASQKVRCDVCNVECASIQLYKNHLYGKKHKNNLEKNLSMGIIFPAGQSPQSIKTRCSASVMGTPSGKGMAEATSVVTNFETKKQNSVGAGEKGTSSLSGKGTEGFTDLERKKQKLLEGGIAVQSLRVGTIRNVVCNGEIAFSKHLVGKKHLTQVQVPAIIVNPSATSATNPKPKGDDEIAKKTNVVGSARCELCNVNCTSFEDLLCHKKGKRHKENIEKSQNPKTGATTPAPASSTARPPLAQFKEPNKVEAKKKNVLDCGAAADAVRICTLCNVVCNSETVFNSHLAGQKHASIVKQKEAGNGS